MRNPSRTPSLAGTCLVQALKQVYCEVIIWLRCLGKSGLMSHVSGTTVSLIFADGGEMERMAFRADTGILQKDFDFGEQRLRELKEKTGIEWLLSNAISSNKGKGEQGNGSESVCDKMGRLREKELLAGAKMWHTAVLQGYKVGFLGLAGR